MAVTLTFSTLIAHAQRDTIPMNNGWEFQMNSSEFTGKQAIIDLPHDFLISQPWVAPEESESADNSDNASNTKSRLSARGFKEMGIGWYRKSFHPHSSWKDRRIELDFGGIMLVGDVFLNGKRIGGTDYGYVGFGIDITDKILWDRDNTITVKADTQGERNSRWYTGGGLYRDVNIMLTPKDNYFVRHPLHISTDMNGMVAIEAEIMSDMKKAESTVIYVKITDADGKEVASCVNKFKNDKRRQRIFELDTLHIKNPHLWDCDAPYLYTAEVSTINENGQTTDKVSEQFGIRTIEYSPEFGFKLNGKKTLLKGIANHHTLGALGAAAYPRAIEKRIKLLKEFGFNHIRTSHNPYSEDLYKLCDRYGILVVDELYDKWLKQYAGGRTEWTNLWQNDIPEWVKAHRNHPSVIMWSLGNELQQYASLPFADYGVTPFRLQRELLHKYDKSRPVTVAMHPKHRSFETDSIPCDLARITDIQAYNYRYMYFDSDGKRFPYMNFYQSEANLSDMGPNFFRLNHDKVIGLAYWGMIDYIGESRGWPAKGWTDGVFDISLQPKPMAWFLKSMFSPDPVVHIAIVNGRKEETKWNGVNFGGETLIDHWNLTPGQHYSVYTFTNADEVELFVNGKSIGKRINDKKDCNVRNRIKWEDIEFKDGKIEAVAKTNGKVVARHAIETAGKAVALKLVPDNDKWEADGTDLQHIRIMAVDSKGRKVNGMSDDITFSVTGNAKIIAVDNGDMENHEINTLPHIHMHNGTALAILRAGNEKGEITFYAKAGKLKKSIKMRTN